MLDWIPSFRRKLNRKQPAEFDVVAQAREMGFLAISARWPQKITAYLSRTTGEAASEGLQFVGTLRFCHCGSV